MRCVLILLSFFIYNGETRADSSSTCRISAVVNNNVITKADLMNRLRFAAISSGLEPTPQNLDRMKEQMLRVMIDEQLQREIGQKFGINIGEEQLNAAIKDLEQSNGMVEGSIARMMQENHIPFKTFEDQIRAQLTWIVYIREKYPFKTLEDQVKKSHTNDISPSLQIADWEIDQEIKQQKEKETKTQYHLAEIFLPVDRPDQEESVKRNLEQLTEELKKGAQFTVLAQQFSQSASASLGGDMGWLSEDQLENEVKEAIMQIQPGQLSTPIRTPHGYTIVAFLERKLPGKDRSVLVTMQQALFPFPQNATEEQAREIMHIAGKVGLQSKSCSDFEKIAKEKFPTVAFHSTPNEPLSNLAEPLQKIVASLDINQGSEPFLTQDGGLVLMVCEKKSQKEQVFTREDAETAIAGRKYALLARRESRDLKRHAFIDVRM